MRRRVRLADLDADREAARKYSFFTDSMFRSARVVLWYQSLSSSRDTSFGVSSAGGGIGSVTGVTSVLGVILDVMAVGTAFLPLEKARNSASVQRRFPGMRSSDRDRDRGSSPVS